MSSIEKKPDGTIVITTRLTLTPGIHDQLIERILGAPPRRRAATIVGLMLHGVASVEETQVEDESWDLDDLGEEL